MSLIASIRANTTAQQLSAGNASDFFELVQLTQTHYTPATDTLSAIDTISAALPAALTHTLSLALSRSLCVSVHTHFSWH
jgi:hypothetical protein